MNPYVPLSCLIPLRWKIAVLVTAVLIVLLGSTVGIALLIDWIIKAFR